MHLNKDWLCKDTPVLPEIISKRAGKTTVTLRNRSDWIQRNVMTLNCYLNYVEQSIISHNFQIVNLLSFYYIA
jgi:hypothetical protein